MTNQFAMGAIPQFDPRSKLFSVAQRLTPEQLANPVSKVWPCSIVLNQGQNQSCVGNAQAYDLAGEPCPIAGVNEGIANKIFQIAQTLDGIPLPHSGTSVLAGIKAVKKLWPTAFQSYHWAFDMKHLLATVSYIGPVIMGTNWLNDMFFPNAKGLIHCTGAIRDRHSYWIHKVDMENKRLGLLQSWGAGWGVKGEAEVLISEFEPLFLNGGECAVLTDRAMFSL